MNEHSFPWQETAQDPIAAYTNRNNEDSERELSFAERDIMFDGEMYMLEVGELEQDLAELKAQWNEWLMGR